MSSALEIVRLGPRHTEAVRDLFSRIAADGTSRQFHPHPLTCEYAERICHYDGGDLYFGLRVYWRFLAYGMLRGWDEGFAVPSLGI